MGRWQEGQLTLLEHTHHRPRAYKPQSLPVVRALSVRGTQGREGASGGA
jgi:hypothetical protein